MTVVVIKRSRLAHHSKYWGGVLNVKKHYYVRKVSSNVNPLNQLKEIVNGKTC